MDFNKAPEEDSSSSDSDSSSQDKSIPSFKNEDNTSVKTAMKQKNEQLLKS